MKKVLVVMLALIMAFSFTACGGGDDEGETAGKVGAIYIGNINDGGFTQGMNEGLEKAAKENGLELMYKENVAEDAQAVKDAATNFIDQGCTIIVGCSFGYGEPLYELANSEEYKDITFLHFSGSYQNETNMENFFGSMEEARYLSGMAAAATSESGTLGYVAAFSDVTEVEIGINAFTLGAQAINPDVEVKVVAINTWGDAELEKSAAEQLIGAGCDVLTYHVDSTATQLAAKDAGIYTTGWNYPNNVAEDKYITAPYWNMYEYFNPTFAAILDGSFKPSGNQPFSYYGSMESGLIGIDEFGEAVPEDALKKINEVKEQMEKGEFEVFSGAIKCIDGTMLCEEGQTLSDEEIWTNITKGKLVEGVTVTSN